MLSTDIKQIGQAYPEYLSSVERNYKWNFVVIALDSSFFAFAMGMLSQDTIIPYFVSQLTESRLLISLVPALYYLGLFFPQLLGAYLVHGSATRKWAIFWIATSERLGILAIALVAQSLGVLSNTQALTLLFLAYALFTVTSGLIGPAYSDFISKNIIRNRGLFYGLMYGLGNLFGFVAGLTAAYLLDRYDFPRDLQSLFWIGFATSFISPFLIAAFREVPFPDARRTLSLAAFLREIPAQVRAVPAFQRFMVVRAILGLGIIANAFYALYALERFDLSDGALGVFTLVILLSQSVLGLLWGTIGDRFGFKRVFVIGAMLVMVMGILALSAFSVWAFYLVAVCVGGFYAAVRTADSTMVFEIAPPSETSRFIGISNTFIAPTMTLAALVGGIIVDAVSYEALFALVLLIGAIATVLTIRYMPDPRHPPHQD